MSVLSPEPALTALSADHTPSALSSRLTPCSLLPPPTAGVSSAPPLWQGSSPVGSLLPGLQGRPPRASSMVLPGSLAPGSESHHPALPTSFLPAQTLVPPECSCFLVLGTPLGLGSPPGLSPGCPPSPPPSEALYLHTSSTMGLRLPGVLLKDFGSLDACFILGVHPWLSLVMGRWECPQEPSDGSSGSEGGDGSRNMSALSSFGFCGCSQGTHWLRGQVHGWWSF